MPLVVGGADHRFLWSAFSSQANYRLYCGLVMLYYRRRLPHWIPNNTAIFITWRLAGSVPPKSPDFLTPENTGRISFRERDERSTVRTVAPFGYGSPP